MIKHIDTTDVFFRAPDNISSYSTWLEARYNATSSPAGYMGVAQHINRLIYAAKHLGVTLIATGPDARQAAEVIMKIAGRTIKVGVDHGKQ